MTATIIPTFTSIYRSSSSGVTYRRYLSRTPERQETPSDSLGEDESGRKEIGPGCSGCYSESTS
jgi:hypothetical protein